MEVLFVIAVFWVGILTVLHGINQTVLHKELVKMKIQASFLWREGIEMLYNVRKGNAYKELPWNCIPKYIRNNEEHINNFCDGFWGSGGLIWTGVGLKIAMGTGNNNIFEFWTGYITGDFESTFNTFRLCKYQDGDKIQYFHSWGCVDLDEWNNTYKETNFARYLIFKPLLEGTNELPQDKVIKVESHILYNNSALLTGEEIIETILGNYEI